MPGMRGFIPFLLAASLTAQGHPDPLRFVPADCEIVIRTRGPAAWKKEFAATGLAKTFGDPALAPKWEALFEALAQDAEFGEEERERLGELPAMLREYSGEIAAAFRIDWEDMDLSAKEPPGAMVLAFGPDGKTDLDALRERLADALPAAQDVELELGGTPAALRRSGSWEMAGPILHRGCVVLVMGTDLERQARQFFEVDEDGPAAIEGDVARATFGLRLALGRVLTRLCELPGDEPRLLGMFRDLGLGAISDMTLTMFPDGAYVGQTLALDFNDAERGLLGFALPARRASPALLRYLPRGARTYAAAPLDGKALLELYPRVFELGGEILPMSREQFDELFTDYTKLSLLDDVLALIGDEYMRIEDVSAVVDYTEDMPESVEKAQDNFANTCFVLQVTDGRKLGRSLDTAIRARGLHVGRKREEYAGTTIYRLTLLGMFPVEYAVTDSLFVLGMGDSEGTKQNVRGVLDAAAAAGAEPFEFSPEVKERLDGLPEGWSGIEVASLTEVLDGFIGTFEQFEGEFLEDHPGNDPWTAVVDLAKAMRPELARKGAATAVTVDYYTKDRWLSKSRW